MFSQAAEDNVGLLKNYTEDECSPVFVFLIVSVLLSLGLLRVDPCSLSVCVRYVLHHVPEGHASGQCLG